MPKRKIEYADRHDAFVQIANRRLNIAKKYLNLVVKMVGSPNYQVTEEDIEKITAMLYQYAESFQHALKPKTKEIENTL